MTKEPTSVENQKTKKMKTVVTIVAAVIFFVVLIIIAFYVSQTQNAKKAEARVQHDVAVGEYDLHWGQLQEAIAEGESILKTTAPDDVTEVTLLESLENALVTAESFEKLQAINADDARTAEIIEDTEKFINENHKLVEAEKTLSDTFQPVKDSVEAKTIKNLRDDVSELLAEAETVLAESERIQFAKEVLALRGAIEVAKEIVADQNASIKQLQVAHENLVESIETVKLLLSESEPKPEDIDGDWCPALDSDADSSECISIELPNITFIKDKQKKEIRQDEENASECFGFVYGDFTNSSQQLMQILYCPAGVELDLPDDYKGIDYPGEDRIWSLDDKNLWLRR